MLKLSAKIEIKGTKKWTFEKITACEIVRDMDALTTTCTLTLPKKTQWQDETSNPLKRGDEVSVWLGYDDDLQLVFKGYILQKGFKAPLVIKCEDEMFQLKQTEAKKKTYKSVTLETLLKDQGLKYPIKVLGEQIDVPVYTEEGNTNPVEIAENAIKYARNNHLDLVIVDTAGRLAVDEQMMQEIAAIKKAIKPQETLFVVDSMTGQDAVNTAKEFNDRLDFDGVVLTKLDGDTRGGAALSIRTVVTKPIKFVGTGEKMDALDLFHPARMADRILGMGDIVSLVEKAQNAYDEEEARKLQRKIAKNQFDFNDYLNQIQQIKKMGNLKDLAAMIPGVGKAIKDIDIDDNAFKGIEAIIHSMTKAERANPQIINASRRQRIARGSGTTIVEVNRMLKQFEQMRKMMKMATSMKNPMKMMRGMRRPH